MIKLVVIADDFTGALDTGVQFAGKGISTKIINERTITKERLEHIHTEVLVIDTETRHVSQDAAYDVIEQIVTEAKKGGIPYIYKKTDSGLRGNIGKELEAALEASGEQYLTFIPAYPAMNRVTVNGIHYIDGKPIHESMFGKDLFEPVRSPAVSDLFPQTVFPVKLYGRMEHYERTDGREIGIFDASTADDIELIVQDLLASGKMGVMAGCAGLASVLADQLGFRKRDIRMPEIPKNLFIVCGSVSDISGKQITYGQENGMERIVMIPSQLIEPGYLHTEDGHKWLQRLKKKSDSGKTCVIETGISHQERMTHYLKKHQISQEQARVAISRRLGSVLKELLSMGMLSTIMVVGGDTLHSFVDQIDCGEISIITEIEKGVVLSSMELGGKRQFLISKSGGFGDHELLIHIDRKVRS